MKNILWFLIVVFIFYSCYTNTSDNKRKDITPVDSFIISKFETPYEINFVNFLNDSSLICFDGFGTINFYHKDKNSIFNYINSKFLSKYTGNNDLLF